MKVILNLKTKQYNDLTPNKVYRVIGIEAADFRILNDEERPYLYPNNLFSIVDPYEPDEWITEYGEEGERFSYPRELNRAGFFEDYFDDDKEAILTFESWQMVQRIRDETENFPEEDFPGCGYWHMHLPVSQGFIDSPETPKAIRKTCIQTLIDRAGHLCSIKPADISTRVVAAINLPHLFGAQLIVFFGSEYFDNFFDRNSPEQKWILLPNDRSLVEEWDLGIPDNFEDRGYREIIEDEDYSYDGEIWFIGELGDTR